MKKMYNRIRIRKMSKRAEGTVPSYEDILYYISTLNEAAAEEPLPQKPVKPVEPTVFQKGEIFTKN